VEEKIKTPEEFLLDFGIELQKTTLISFIDETMKQPSLTFLLLEYAKYVLEMNEKQEKNQNKH
jgi:hypothetical protein